MVSVEDSEKSSPQLASLPHSRFLDVMQRSPKGAETNNQPDPLPLEQLLIFLLYPPLKGQCHAICYLLKKLKLFFASIEFQK